MRKIDMHKCREILTDSFWFKYNHQELAFSHIVLHASNSKNILSKPACEL